MSNNKLHNSRCVMIVSGPSGSGKSTLCDQLIKDDVNLELSISYTSRDQRPMEREGKDYHFLSKNVFQKMIDDGSMLEYTEIYGNYYGSPKETIRINSLNNKDTLFDIESKGARFIKTQIPNETFTVFVMPSDISELENRLKLRGRETEEEIKIRLSNAKKEIEQSLFYDYVVKNDDFLVALADLKSILRAERLKAFRITKDFCR
ncbi:MAG: guanylate kinase [Rickettsiaceae bacterium]|nr:guanylate kinase [Rickettsiaceae bacterium]